MRTSLSSVCSELKFQSQPLWQNNPSSNRIGTTVQHRPMATSSINTSSASYHGLPDCTDQHNHGLSNASVMAWPLNSSGAVSPFQNGHYDLETIPDWLESEIQIDTSGRTASTSSASYMNHSSWLRTYPSMDLSPMLADSTIAPRDLYHYNSPLAEPHKYSTGLATHVPQRIFQSTEDHASMPQDHLQYFNQHEDIRSCRGTPLDDNIVEEDAEEESEKPEPYAKLIFRCLRDAPGHELFLREIYDWFRLNTDKVKNPHEKGWQNSVRHNLSMNKDFEKIPQDLSNPSKKGTKWRLSTQALLQGGVQSTTRYRNKQPKSRGTKSRPPAPHRQASGARGGRMAAAQMRRLQLERGLQRELGRSCYNLRSAGNVMADMAMPGQIHVPGSPDYAVNSVIVNDLADPHSTGSSPYPGVAQSYDWSQHSQYPLTPDSLMPHAAQYHSYTASPETPVSRLRMIPDTLFLPTSNDFSGSYMLTSPVTPDGYEHLGIDPILNFDQASSSGQS